MGEDEAGAPVGAEAGRVGAHTARVRLPPLWLFGGLAVALLLATAATNTQDVVEYHCYALNFWQGAKVANTALGAPCSASISDLASRPFQELPREYGPLSLVVFSLPMLAPSSWYNAVFYTLMCFVILGIAWLLDRYGPRGAGQMWLLYTMLGAMLEAAGRFDALPAAAVLVALLAAQRGRALTAYGSLAVGALLKFYPLGLLPLLLIVSWRRRRDEPFWRGPALFAGIIGVGEVIAALISPQRALAPLGFMGARCVEVEAFPATLSYLWATLTGGQVKVMTVAQYSSVCQFGPALDVTQAIMSLIAIATLAAVYWLVWTGRLTLAHGFLFATGALIIGVKVFSIQYLLWLSPLVAYIYGLDLLALIGWGAVCLATTFYYPVASSPWVVVNFGVWLVDHLPLLIAFRNALFVLVGGLALWDALRRPAASAPSAMALAAPPGARP